MPFVDDGTPPHRLTKTVDCALIAIDVDSEAASWLAYVRAAVRRTRRRLFVLFQGNDASHEPCQALTDLAAAALEVVASEGRPQLCLVPLFATAGWAAISRGEVPKGVQSKILSDITVVFVAAPCADKDDLNSFGNSVSAHSDEECERRHNKPVASDSRCSRGRVVYHRKTMAGCLPPQSSGEESGEISKRNDRSGHGGLQNSSSSSEKCVKGSTGLTGNTKPIKCASRAASDDSDPFSFAMVLAEALSSARQSRGVEGPVAVGDIEAALPSGDGAEDDLTIGSSDRRAWRHVAVGGTFDRLHAGHRILLAATAITATEAAYIGITGPALLQNKNHHELLQSFEARESAAKEYLQLVRPGLAVHTAELHNPKGLASEIGGIEALVVSTETAQGAPPINEDRLKRGFAPLQVVTVALVGATGGTAAKLSSTTLRADEAKLQSSRKDVTAKRVED